jgi:hypothetical protein
MQRMIGKRKNWKIYFMLFWVLMFGGCKSVNPKIEAGFLDLSGWDFQAQSIELDGEWEFYWSQLLTPADFKSDSSLKCDYIAVPKAWKGYRLNQHFQSGIVRAITLGNQKKSIK